MEERSRRKEVFLFLIENIVLDTHWKRLNFLAVCKNVSYQIHWKAFRMWLLIA